MVQCSPFIKSQLESVTGYSGIEQNQDVIELLKLIQRFSCQHDWNTQVIHTLMQSIRQLFCY